MRKLKKLFITIVCFWGIAIFFMASSNLSDVLGKVLHVHPSYTGGDIAEVITEPAKELSPFAPSITTMTIPVEDIGAVIGPGGKQIREIIDASGAEIDIQDNGIVTITSNDQEGAKIAMKMINDITFKPEVGMVIRGKVVRIIAIGAFVELGGGKDGMIHISQVSNERIDTIEPHLNIGDEVVVKVIKIDEKGRVNLTLKGVTDEDRANCIN